MKFPIKNVLAVISIVSLAFLNQSCSAQQHDQHEHGQESLHDEGESDLGPSLYTHTLSTPFLHSEYDNEWWDFGGNTVIKVYDYIRLTIQQPSQTGWIWSKLPLTAKAWQVDFEFRIHGDNPTLFGDGFAFWFAEGHYEKGPVFGFKDHFKGLGIFFDTFPNGNHDHSFPYISAMIGDGKRGYDHANDNKGSLAGHGCEANIRGSKDPLRARVIYYKNHILKLEFTDNAGKGWQTCFVLSKVDLPDAGFIGFTSRTGELYDNHDIHRVTTHTLQHDEEYKGNDATDMNNQQQETGRIVTPQHSTFGYIVRFIGFGGLVVVGYYAYRAYSRQDAAKRF